MSIDTNDTGFGRAKKALGQHFLHERGVIDRIVHAIDPKPGERIVEIGPGQGALTFPLLRAHRTLTVIEFDRDLIAPLTAAAGPISFVALAAPQIGRRITGAAGVPLLPAALTLHHEHGLDLLDVLRPLTQGPAALLGLDAGELAQGAPAALKDGIAALNARDITVEEIAHESATDRPAYYVAA